MRCQKCGKKFCQLSSNVSFLSYSFFVMFVVHSTRRSSDNYSQSQELEEESARVKSNEDLKIQWQCLWRIPCDNSCDHVEDLLLPQTLSHAAFHLRKTISYLPFVFPSRLEKPLLVIMQNYNVNAIFTMLPISLFLPPLTSH